jgi:hypothetical protein
MSIATASFSFLRSAYVIGDVQTIAETRRQRLQMLIDEVGSLADLNDRLERPRTDATLTQIKNQSPHHKTGKPRSMGDDIARDIETRLGKPEGWMDTPPTYSELHGTPDLAARASEILSAMEPEAQYQAIRLLDALAQPPKTNGTNASNH